MAIETFDDFDSYGQETSSNNGVPFELREDTSEKGTLEWLTDNFDTTYRESVGRLESYRRWSQLFKGIHYRSQRGKDSRKPKIVDNYIWELITRKVDLMASKSTSFSAIPYNWNDQHDINNAKACELLLKARADELELDSKHTDVDKLKYKYGTGFLMTFWDEEAGGIIPEFLELKEFYKGKIPSTVLKRIGGTVYRGDVGVKVIEPWYIFPERDKKKWEDVKHYDYVEWKNVHELKRLYPKTASDLGTNTRLMWDMESAEVTQPDHLIAVRTFYHKPTRWLPEGARIVYTDDAIHEWTEYPYSKMEDLNLIIDRDITIEDELWGRPNITQIEQHQRAVNNIESSVHRDLGVGSAPKWMVPKGSVDFKVINNEFTVVEFRGPIKPELVRGNPVSSDAVGILNRKKARMQELMRVTDTQKGEVPPGITANSALRFLDEQAGQAIAGDDKSRKKRIRRCYKQMASIAAEFYNEEDERVVRKLGPDNSYLIRSMKQANFSEVADIQIQNSSALPDTRSGKIATIIDMNTATQTDPVFKRDEIVRMLGLANDKEFVDQAMAAANTANAIFQDMMDGAGLPEPDPSDNLMVYYSVFAKRIQDYGYRVKATEDIKNQVREFLTAVEMMLIDKANNNAKIAEWLGSNDYFPMYYMPPTPPAMQQTSVGGGADISKMENTSKTIEEAMRQDGGV